MVFVIAGEERGRERKSRGSDWWCLPLQSELALAAIKVPLLLDHQGTDDGKESVTRVQSATPM